MRLVERFSAPLLFFLLAAVSLGLCIYKPFHNWDMIGYIGAAKSFEEQDVYVLHTFTFDQLRRSVSKEEYKILTSPEGDDEHAVYRRAISTDSSAFKEQLPFYQIRPVYTGLIYLLYKTGINIAFATHLISGFAVVVAIAFLYLMSVSFLAKPFIYAVPPLAIIFGVLDLARYSTPDGLAFLSVIASVFLYLNACIAMLLVLLPIILGIRTDLILFTTPLLFLIFLFDKRNRWKAALSTIISVVIYSGIGAYWGNRGWSTVFYFTFVEILAHPISIPPTLTAQEYFYALFNGTELLVSNKSFVLYLLLAAYSLYLIKSRAKMASVATAFTLSTAVTTFACLAFVGSHFLAFPVAWDNRFFTAPELIGGFSLLILMTNYLRELKSVQQGAALAGIPLRFRPADELGR
jgi:hypothetical protein